MSGSSPEVGSSRMSSSAVEASAATRPTFCRLPLEYVRALLGGVELEALEQLVAPLRVEVAAEPAEQVDDLAAAQLRPQRHLARHVREPPVQGDRVAPRVAAEQPDGAGVGAEHPEQDADRRGLARSVRAEEAVDLAGADLEIEPVERPGGAEGLDESRDLDRLRHARLPPAPRGARSIVRAAPGGPPEPASARIGR